MRTFKRSLIVETTLLLLGLASSPALGGFFPGGSLRDHGHTGANDGGVLNAAVINGINPSTRLTVTRTSAYTSGIDPVIKATGTYSPGASGLIAGVYGVILSTYTGSGAGHAIGVHGEAYTTSATNDQLLIGTEGKAVQVSTYSNARSYGVVGRGIMVSATTTGNTPVAGVYASGECYSDTVDGTPNAGCLPISYYAAPTVGGPFGYSFFASDAGDIMYQAGPATFGNTVTNSGMTRILASTATGSGKFNTSVASTFLFSWSEEEDRTSEFNGSTFTAANTGVYLITVTGNVDTDAAASVTTGYVYVLKGGGSTTGNPMAQSGFDGFSAGPASGSLSASIAVSVTAGEAISIWGACNDSLTTGPCAWRDFRLAIVRLP